MAIEHCPTVIFFFFLNHNAQKQEKTILGVSSAAKGTVSKGTTFFHTVPDTC